MKRENYRAPREHRSALILPEPDCLPQVVGDNRRLLAGYRFDLAGRPVQSLRDSARRGLLALPYKCIFGRRRHDGDIDPEAVIVLTGHQPALYHPGVWLKNFLAGHLAEATGGVAINLNVDNDESHQLTVRAPVRRDGRVRVVEVPYLRPTGGLPYEELSPDLLLDGVADALRTEGVAEPLCEAVADYWRRLEAARSRGSLVKIITCARHQLELDAGLENLEALVSDVARLPEYRLFILDVLSRLDEFHEAHNGGLATFRRVHHERNAAQPIPDLGRDGPQWEMPFWVWQSGHKRERLWAATAGDRLLLYIDGRAEPFVSIERRALADGAGRAIAQLDEQEAEGIKVRPRALTLTLFARVFLGDVFIHGLGGAIYDKVTDEIIRTYYGVEPPQLVMATGTALLPLESFDATAADRRDLLRRLRDVRHGPERLIGRQVRGRPDVRSLMARKRQLIEDRPAERGARAAAWRELHDVNHRLATLLSGEPDATRQRLGDVERQLAENAILKNREYTFALHPRDELIAFYNEATAVRPGGAP